MMSTELKDTAKRYEQELLEREIPFWLEHSIDTVNGGYFSCLARDGHVFDGMKQLWMQWREVYMLAVLYNSEYSDRRYLDLAVKGFEFCTKYGKRPDGLYYLILNADGSPLALDENGAALFVESFAAIACAELYRATGEERFRKEAELAFRNYWKRVDAATTPLPGAPRRVMFAHDMIGLNVTNVMKEAGIAADLGVDLAKKVFTYLEPDSGIIFERRREDGTFELDRQDGRICKPGHALEGLAFVLESNPDDATAAQAVAVTRRTLEWGWDSVNGGITYHKDILGEASPTNDCMLKAWWPQNEAAVASLLSWKRTGDPAFLEWFRKIDAFSWENLRDSEYGEWYPFAPLNGVLYHSYKGSRWKGFFHIPRYLLKCIRLLNA